MDYIYIYGPSLGTHILYVWTPSSKAGFFTPNCSMDDWWDNTFVYLPIICLYRPNSFEYGT